MEWTTGLKTLKLFKLTPTTKCLDLVKPINVGICGDAKAVAEVSFVKNWDSETLNCDSSKADRAVTIIANEKAVWELELG